MYIKIKPEFLLVLMEEHKQLKDKLIDVNCDDLLFHNTSILDKVYHATYSDIHVFETTYVPRFNVIIDDITLEKVHQSRLEILEKSEIREYKINQVFDLI